MPVVAGAGDGARVAVNDPAPAAATTSAAGPRWSSRPAGPEHQAGPQARAADPGGRPTGRLTEHLTEQPGRRWDGLGVTGSDEDFAAVYRAELAGLVRHVMFHGASLDQAWDAAQSAFSQAYPVWSRIRVPRAWLRTVAVRAYWRSAVPETPTDALPDQPDPASGQGLTPVELGEQERLVLRALAELPVKQRQVMAWTIDGYAPTEIAEALGEDPAAIRQNLRRARKNLASTLAARGKDTR